VTSKQQKFNSHIGELFPQPKKIVLNETLRADASSSQPGRAQKVAASLLGEKLAAREPVWDGEGWGCDRIA
jgi:hypothetical protein